MMPLIGRKSRRRKKHWPEWVNSSERQMLLTRLNANQTSSIWSQTIRILPSLDATIQLCS